MCAHFASASVWQFQADWFGFVQSKHCFGKINKNLGPKNWSSPSIAGQRTRGYIIRPSEDCSRRESSLAANQMSTNAAQGLEFGPLACELFHRSHTHESTRRLSIARLIWQLGLSGSVSLLMISRFPSASRRRATAAAFASRGRQASSLLSYGDARLFALERPRASTLRPCHPTGRPTERSSVSLPGGLADFSPDFARCLGCPSLGWQLVLCIA